MQPNDRTKKDAPQQVLPSTGDYKDRTQRGDGYPVPPADPHLEFVFAKVRNIRQKICRIVVHGPARQNPNHVRPQATVVRRMRITLLVRVLVMHAVSRNPKNRTAFQLNTNSAATAPICYATIKRVVTHTKGCVNVLSCLKIPRIRISLPSTSHIGRGGVSGEPHWLGNTSAIARARRIILPKQ